MKKFVMYIGNCPRDMWTPKFGTIGILVDKSNKDIVSVKWPKNSIVSKLKYVYCYKKYLLEINYHNIKKIVKELVIHAIHRIFDRN